MIQRPTKISWRGGHVLLAPIVGKALTPTYPWLGEVEARYGVWYGQLRLAGQVRLIASICHLHYIQIKTFTMLQLKPGVQHSSIADDNVLGTDTPDQHREEQFLHTQASGCRLNQYAYNHAVIVYSLAVFEGALGREAQVFSRLHEGKQHL